MRRHLIIATALAAALAASAATSLTPATAQEASLTEQPRARSCVAIDVEISRANRSRAGFRNNCDYPVNVAYCMTLRRGSSEDACPNTGVIAIDAQGFAVRSSLRRSEQVFVFACNQAHQMVDTHWDGTGFSGRCLG